MARPLLKRLFSTAPLLPLSLSMTLGLCVGSRLTVGPWWWLWVPLVAAVVVMRGRAAGQWLLLCAAFLLLGVGLMNRQQRLLRVAMPRAGTTVQAVIVSPPAEREHTVAVDLLTADRQQLLHCYIYKEVKSLRLRLGDGVVVTVPAHDKPFVRPSQWHRVTTDRTRLPFIQRSRLWFLEQRERMLSRYRQYDAPEDVFAVLAAMTLGQKNDLRREVRDVYARTGTSHVLALSGLHLGIIYLLLGVLLPVRRHRVVAQAVLLPAVWSFVLLVGLPVSVVRAATMLTVYALLSAGHRRGLSLNVLALTAIVMLMLRPLWLFDVGFQLSFLSMLGILTALPLIAMRQRWCRERGQMLRSWLWGWAAVSVSAQLATAPLVAFYFGRVPLLFLLSNAVLVPFVYVLLLGSLLQLAFPALMPLVLGAAGLLNRLLSLLAAVPFACLSGLHPTAVQVLLAYALLAVCCCLLYQARRRF